MRSHLLMHIKYFKTLSARENNATGIFRQVFQLKNRPSLASYES